MKKKKPIPYDFVFDLLEELPVHTNPMFGCTAVYCEEKILLILREKETETQDNGVWLATTKDHHDSLKKDFPHMRSISILGKGVTGWQILGADTLDFDSAVEKACEFILKGDERIGKVPKPKKKKKPLENPSRGF